MNKKIITIIIILIVGIIILRYFLNTREGFQTDSSTTDEPVTSSVEPGVPTPEACILLNSMYENMKANYIKAEEGKNPYILNSLSASLNHVKKSLTDIGCIYNE